MGRRAQRTRRMDPALPTCAVRPTAFGHVCPQTDAYCRGTRSRCAVNPDLRASPWIRTVAGFIRSDKSDGVYELSDPIADHDQHLLRQPRRPHGPRVDRPALRVMHAVILGGDQVARAAPDCRRPHNAVTPMRQGDM